MGREGITEFLKIDQPMQFEYVYVIYEHAIAPCCLLVDILFQSLSYSSSADLKLHVSMTSKARNVDDATLWFVHSMALWRVDIAIVL